MEDKRGRATKGYVTLCSEQPYPTRRSHPFCIPGAEIRGIGGPLKILLDPSWVLWADHSLFPEATVNISWHQSWTEISNKPSQAFHVSFVPSEDDLLNS